MTNEILREAPVRRYRPHRGSLGDSMAKCVGVSSLSALVDLIRERLKGCCSVTDIRVIPYSGADDRIGWRETWAVQVKGWADAPDDWRMDGFTDGPLK